MNYVQYLDLDLLVRIGQRLHREGCFWDAVHWRMIVRELALQRPDYYREVVVQEDGYTSLLECAIRLPRAYFQAVLDVGGPHTDLCKLRVLKMAIFRNIVHVVEAVLDTQYPHLNVAWKDGNTLLKQATRIGRKACVEVLLRYGAHPDAKNIAGLTIFLLCAIHIFAN